MREGQSTIFSQFTLVIAVMGLILVWSMLAIYSVTDDISLAASIATEIAAVWACGAMPFTAGFTSPICIAAGTASGLVTASTFGGLVVGAEDIQGLLIASNSIYETSSYPSQILQHNYSEGRNVRSVVQEYAYCQATGGPCSIDRAKLKVAVKEVVQERDYKLTLDYAGGELTVKNTNSFEKGPGPAYYRTVIPLKGGKTASMELLVEGYPGGILWPR